IFLTQLEELWAHQVSLRDASESSARRSATTRPLPSPTVSRESAGSPPSGSSSNWGRISPGSEVEKDRQLRGAHVQRRLHGRDDTQGAHHRHGSRVHKGNPHRELVDGGPQGSGPPCEVHAGMACERQQEESDRRGGTDADRTVSGLPYVWHALRHRCRSVVYMATEHYNM